MLRTLEIEMQDTNNDTLKKSIGYVNPNSTDDDLLDFVEGLVKLTTNTHIRTKKIDTTDLMRGE